MPPHLRTPRTSWQHRVQPSALAADYAASAVAALVLYAAYAQLGGRWASGALIAAAGWFLFSLPLFARLSNWLQARIHTVSGSSTVARCSRVLLQWAYNLALYRLFLATHIVEASAVDALGGVLGGALLTTMASNGFQFTALALAGRGIGSEDGNVTLAMCLTVLVTALAVHDLPVARSLFIAFGAAIALLTILAGVHRELRLISASKEKLP